MCQTAQTDNISLRSESIMGCVENKQISTYIVWHIIQFNLSHSYIDRYMKNDNL